MNNYIFWIVGILTMLIGYLIGSVSFSILITRAKGINIKKVGSGNAGATNVTRSLGKKYGALILIIGFLKPIISGLITLIIVEFYLGKEMSFFIQLSAFSAVIGHIFPIFHKFKGGKGAACTAGFLIMSNWIFFPLGFILFLSLMYSTRYASLASILSVFILSTIYLIFTFFPIMIGPYFSFFDPDKKYVTLGLCYGLFIIVTFVHKNNISRLLNGTENKIKGRNKK